MLIFSGCIGKTLIGNQRKNITSHAMRIALCDSRFSHHVVRFSSHLSANLQLSHHTVRNYLNDLVPFINFLKKEDSENLSEIDRSFLRRYLATLVSNGFERNSIARKLSALRSFLSFMTKHGEIASDPSDLISSPRAEKKLPNIASSFEIDRLLEAPDSHTHLGLRDRAILEVLYGTGLRVAEAYSMNINDLSLENREILVTGKGNKQRMVLFGNETRRYLKIYIDEARP